MIAGHSFTSGERLPVHWARVRNAPGTHFEIPDMSADTNVKIYFIAFSVADVFQDADQVVDQGVFPVKRRFRRSPSERCRKRSQMFDEGHLGAPKPSSQGGSDTDARAEVMALKIQELHLLAAFYRVGNYFSDRLASVNAKEFSQ
jgi:hypothetical protein